MIRNRRDISAVKKKFQKIYILCLNEINFTRSQQLNKANIIGLSLNKMNTIEISNY